MISEHVIAKLCASISLLGQKVADSNDTTAIETLLQELIDKVGQYSKPINSCFDTGSGRIKVDGVEVYDIDTNTIIATNVTVLESDDATNPVGTVLTDISSFTSIPCLCENC